MYNNKGFTFVELIVSIVIIIILSTIGFSSYIEYISDSRDSQRISDLSQLSSSLKVYKQKRGYYGNPGNAFNIVYGGTGVVLQGKINQNVHIDSIEKLPLDPKNNKYYSYSITKNKQEFELVASLENGDYPKALLVGNYKSVSKNILPTITLAKDANIGDNIEIKESTSSGDINRKLFIYNNNIHNLVYTFDEPYGAYSDGELSFSGLLDEAEINNDFWQNSDNRNCVEIKEADKLLIKPTTTEFQYQIIDEDGFLTNTGCTISNTQ